MSRETAASDSVHQDPIHTEAARWFTRLQGSDLSLQETAEWQQWMTLDPRHARAFRRLQDVWQAFDGLPRPTLLSQNLVARDRFDASMPVSEWLAQERSAHHRRRGWAFAIAASIAVVAIGIAFLVAPWSSAVEVFETQVGENRTISLADGSRVALGGRTRLEAALSPERRELTLLDGEAFFMVAKDPARRFIVHAGNATVTAVGTEFNVRRSGDRVTVSVVEGRVTVQPVQPIVPMPWVEELAPMRANGSSEPLSAGHRTTVDRSGMGVTTTPIDASVATAWRTGQLAFEDEPLRYVVESVNRYARKPILIEDENLGELRISGTVLGEHIDGWVQSLRTAFQIESVEDERRIRLRRAEP